jgi:hypothetical protein
MSYRARIRKFTKIDNGTYFSESFSISTYFFITLIKLIFAILILPFTAIWCIIKYIIGLPFILIGKIFRR